MTVPLKSLPFWVQIHDISHGLFTEKVGKSLGNFIGTFLEYDESNLGVAWKPYMRIKVEIDVDQPLRRWKKVKISNEAASQVNFKYERLHIFCFISGKLGHSERFCDVPYNTGDAEISKGWGAFLKAPNRRVSPLAGDKWLKTDMEPKDCVEATGEEEDCGKKSENIEVPGAQLADSDFIGKGINRGLAVMISNSKEKMCDTISNDYSQSLIINPCFEEEDTESDLIDPKKGKDLFPCKRKVQLMQHMRTWFLK